MLPRNRFERQRIIPFVTPVNQLQNSSGSIKTDEKQIKNEKLNISNLKVYVTEADYFIADLPDIIPRSLNFTDKENVLRFTRNPLQFYQNQFNMAVWCATSGCGISLKYDLNHPTPLIRSLFRFHFYYQICKILKYLQIPLPGEESFNETKNNINLRNYDFIRKEFRIPNNKKFYIDESWEYNYNPNSHLMDGYASLAGLTFPHMFKKDWDKERKEVDEPYFVTYWIDTQRSIKTFDVLHQKDYKRYLEFILEKTNNLTSPGIQRLNDSIRAFIYCLLGAQAETRSAIINSFGTELDAQKEFKKLLEDSIDKHADIPTSIQRYQKSISDTHIRLDYVIAPGLYIIGSDMVLKIGSIENYNNNILIASGKMKQGKNNINNQINKLLPQMEGNPVRTSKLKSNVNNKEVKPEKPEEVKPEKVKLEEVNNNMKFILFAATSGLVSLALYLSGLVSLALYLS
jgi:hypothetical protein